MSNPASKKRHTRPQYELLYHPGIPGRGEFVRLVFEATGVSYSDIANERDGGYDEVKAACSPKETDFEGNPPAFAPPILRVLGAGRDGKDLLISQTPNILVYLANKLCFAPQDEVDRFHASGIAFTALDLNNETHDTHHPVSVMDYYDDQKDEALRRSTDFRENRLPKYFGYFQRILEGNRDHGKGRYLVGEQLTFADTTLWQVIDGLFFAFPKELHALKTEFPALLDTFYQGVREEDGIKKYLSSDRRLQYSMGIFRHYPELDRQ